MIIDYSKTINKIREHLKNYLVKSKLKSLVIGVSGGIDSALVIALAEPVCKELGIKLIGRSITIQSNKDDEIERAKMMGTFCTDFDEVNLTDKYLVMKELDNMEGESKNDITYKIRMGNIKARMRMIYLYNLASKTGGLVLSTDNYTEYLLGFFTIFGDQGDYSPVQFIWKTEVYEMSDWLVKNELFFNENKQKALQSCIEATATDGLGITNSDLDQILPDFVGSSREGYKKVDEILINYFDNNIFDENSPVIIRKIKSEFKRNHPVMLYREMII